MFVHVQKRGADIGLVAEITISTPVDLTDNRVRVTAFQAPPLTLISALPGAVTGWQTGAGSTEQNFDLPRVGDMQAIVSFFNGLQAADGSSIFEAFYNESSREFSLEAYYNTDIEASLAEKLRVPPSITANDFFITHVDPRNFDESVAYEVSAVGLHVVGAHTGDNNTSVLAYVSREGVIHTNDCHIINTTSSFTVRVSEIKKADLSSGVLPVTAEEVVTIGMSIT